MRILTRTTLLAALLVGAAGAAQAAEGQGKAASAKDAGAPTTSLGAGGLSGTGSTQDGARTGSVEGKGSRAARSRHPPRRPGRAADPPRPGRRPTLDLVPRGPRQRASQEGSWDSRGWPEASFEATAALRHPRMRRRVGESVRPDRATASGG
ncbi:hypothetical protein ACU4GA_28190 [Methylobacterium oryzae CBMB20]